MISIKKSLKAISELLEEKQTKNWALIQTANVGVTINYNKNNYNELYFRVIGNTYLTDFFMPTIAISNSIEEIHIHGSYYGGTGGIDVQLRVGPSTIKLGYMRQDGSVLSNPTITVYGR